MILYKYKGKDKQYNLNNKLIIMIIINQIHSKIKYFGENLKKKISFKF